MKILENKYRKRNINSDEFSLDWPLKLGQIRIQNRIIFSRVGNALSRPI